MPQRYQRPYPPEFRREAVSLVKASGRSINVFLSFSPQSADAIAAWRESPGFQGRVERIRGMLENFEPGVFDSRVEIGPT